MIGLFITTWNQLEKTKKAVESIRKNTSNYELTLIDNRSTDGTIEWAKQNDVRLQVDRAGNNIGAAVNQGIRYYLQDPNIEYIGVLHNDMVFYKGWLDTLVAFQKHTGFSGKFAPNNARQYNVPEEEAVRRMDEARAMNQWGSEPGNECPYMVTTDIFKKDQIFYDERYIGIGGMEDWDFNRRLMYAGYKVLIVRSAYIWHEAMGTRKFLDTDKEAIYNRAYYSRKWGDGKCPV